MRVHDTHLPSLAVNHPPIEALADLAETFSIRPQVGVIDIAGSYHTYSMCRSAGKSFSNRQNHARYREIDIGVFARADDCPECCAQHQPGGQVWTWLQVGLNPVMAADLYRRGLASPEAARGVIGPTVILDAEHCRTLLATLPPPQPLQPGPVVAFTRPPNQTTGVCAAPYDQVFAAGIHRPDGRSIVNHAGRQLLRSDYHIELGHLPDGVDAGAAADIFFTLVDDGEPPGAHTWRTACLL